jgi:hypothetical protein
MTTENKIKIVEDVSDIFLEISKYFTIEMQILDSGYGINIESDYNRIVKLLNGTNNGDSLISSPQIKFKLTSKWSVRTDWENKRKQKILKMTTEYLIRVLPNIEKRLSLTLDKYDITYTSKIVIISPKKGIVKIPLMEEDRDKIESDSRYRMDSNGIFFTSYQSSVSEINSSDEIQVSHVYMTFVVSDKIDIKKKEPEFKFSKIINRFNIFKKS